MTPTTNPPADLAATPAGPTAIDPSLVPGARRDLTDEELERLAGKHIAWTWDGTTILAGADTLGELLRQLDQAGVNTSRVVFDYVDEPGVSYLPGVSFL